MIEAGYEYYKYISFALNVSMKTPLLSNNIALVSLCYVNLLKVQFCYRHGKGTKLNLGSLTITIFKHCFLDKWGFDIGQSAIIAVREICGQTSRNVIVNQLQQSKKDCLFELLYSLNGALYVRER